MKNNIKIVLALLLTFALVFSMTGCKGDKNDAIEAVNKALIASKDVKEVDATIEGDIIGEFQPGKEDKVGIKIDMKTKIPDNKNIDLKKMEAAMDMKMSIMGTSLAMDMFIKDGNVYTNALNTKNKVPMDESMKISTTSAVNADFIDNKIDKAYVKEGVLDGDVATLKIDSKKFFKAVFENLAKDKSNPKDTMTEEQLKTISESVGDIELIFTLDGKKIKDVTFKTNIKEKESKKNYKVKLKIIYNKMGNIGKIKFPKDLSSYKSVDEGNGAGTTPIMPFQ